MKIYKLYIGDYTQKSELPANLTLLCRGELPPVYRTFKGVFLPQSRYGLDYYFTTEGRSIAYYRDLCKYSPPLQYELLKSL